MKTLTVLFATLSLCACNPTFDRPPLLRAGGAAASAPAQAAPLAAASPAPAQRRASAAQAG